MESYSVQAILSATDRSFSNTMGSASKSLGRIEGASERATSSVMKIAAGVGVFKALSAGAGMVRGSIDKAFGRIDTMEQFNRTMTVMLGSSEAAGKALDKVGDIVKGTAYGLDTAAKSTQGFVTAGLDINKSTKSVEGWGNAVAFYGDGTNATFGSVTSQLSKMATKGTVSLEYLNTAIDAGIPVMDIYAKAVGKSTEEVAKEISSGSVKTEEFLDVMNKAFDEGVEGFPSLANAAKNAGASWQGSIDNMKAAVTRGTMGIIQSIDDLLKDGGFPTLRDMIKQVGVVSEKSLGGVADLISKIDMKALIPSAIGFAGALTTVSGATPFLELLPDVYGKISKSGESLINNTKNIGTAFSSDAKNGLESFKNTVTSVPDLVGRAGEGVKGFANDAARTFTNLNISSAADMMGMETKVGGMVDSVIGKSKGLGNMFDSAKGAVTNFQSNVPLVANIFDNMGKSAGLMTNGISQAASIGTSTLTTFLGTMSNLAMLALKAVAPAAIIAVVLVGLGMAVEQFGNEINNMINMAITKGPEVITSFTEGLVSKIPELIETGTNLVGTFATAIQTLFPIMLDAGLNVIQSLVQGVGDNADWLIRSALVIVSTLLEGIITGLPRLIQMGMDLILSLVDGLVNNIPLIVSTITNLVETLLSTLGTGLPQFLQTGIEIITKLIEGIGILLPQLIPIGVSMIVTLIEGLVSMLPGIIQATLNLVQTMLTTLVENLPKLLEGGIKILKAIISGIVEALPQIIEMGIKIIFMLAGSIIQMLPDILSAGWEIIKALATGIIEAIPKVLQVAWDGIKNGFSNLWDTIRGKSKESSESMVVDINTSNTSIAEDYNRTGELVIDYTGRMQAGVTENSSQASSNAGLFANDAYKNVTQSYGNMNSEVVGSTSSMNSGVDSNMKALSSSALGSSSNMNVGVTKDLNSMGQSGTQGTKELEINVTKSMKSMETETSSSMKNMKQSMDTGFKDSSSQARSSMTDITNIVNGGMNNVENSVRSSRAPEESYHVAKGIERPMVGLESSLDNAGYNAGIGMGEGLNRSSSYVYSVADNMANNVANTIQSALDIHSPSRLTDWMGQMLGKGMINGIQSMMGKLSRVSELFSETALPEISNTDMNANINKTLKTSELVNVKHSSSSETRQPLELIVNLPSGKLRAFIKDITNQQQKEIEFEEVFGY